MLSGGRAVSDVVMLIFTKRYSGINYEWLKDGVGEMLLEDSGGEYRMPDTGGGVSEPDSEYLPVDPLRALRAVLEEYGRRLSESDKRLEEAERRLSELEKKQA